MENNKNETSFAGGLNRITKAIAFFNAKGGVGKTTLATQTAVAARMQGAYVVFYDLDAQQSAINYFNTVLEKYRPQEIYTSLSQAPKHQKPDLIILDCAPNMDFIPPPQFMIVAPTNSTSLDLHPYRKVLQLEQQGYKVIKVINNFSLVRNRDKALLQEFDKCCVISANSAIPGAMALGRTIWNSGLPGGKRAKNQFNYLLECIARGHAPSMTLDKIMEISYDKDMKNETA